MKINNINDLRSELIEAFELVKGDIRRVPQGKELGNIAGKIINSCKLQIEYAQMKKEVVTIPFLEESKAS
jgi:hypothetical protein